MNARAGQTGAAPVIADELELMRQWLPLQDASVLDLGCGPAPLSKRLLKEAGVAEVVGMDTDTAALARIREAGLPEGMTLVEGGAQALPFPDARFDSVIMMKSLHHVPVESMDTALSEIARVLRDDGILYVSEPVFAGEFNEVVRMFHDEGFVRAQAIEAMQRAVAGGRYVQAAEQFYTAPGYFRDFADFQHRIINATHNSFSISDADMARIREKFERHLKADGAHFERPMRVNVLKKAAVAA